MPTSTTRSGRVVKNSSTTQSKMDALEMLARQRRGEKVEMIVKEDEPLFEEVNEEDYRKTRKAGFIVDPESDEIDSDLDFIDDDDDFDEEDTGRSRGRSKKSSNKRTKEVFNDPGQRSMKSFLSGSSKSKPVASHSSSLFSAEAKEPELSQDDILNQMLLDVPENKASSVQKKPLKVNSRTTANREASSSQTTRSPDLSTKPLKTKAIFEPTTSAKRPRMASPPLEPISADDAGGLDSWMDDEFDDSLPAANNVLPTPDVSTPAKPITQALPKDLEEDFEELADESDIKAAPLNDDLKSNLEFHPIGDENKSYTRLYWYDCFEDQIKSPGVVYFFGRIFTSTTKKYVSCCTIVKNIQRTCYLLINEGCDYEEVVFEFTNIVAKKLKLRNFKCEKVTKKYAFSNNSKIPLIADYVKVDYSANQQAMPTDLKGETFSCVLNVNQSPMEKIILDLKLRGPCWLKLVEPVASSSQLTWTRIELVLESPSNLLVEENMENLKAPYFCTFSLSIRTYKNPSTYQNEIVAIAGMVNTSFNLDQCLKKTNKASGHFCLMTKPAAGHKELRMPYDFQVEMRKITKTRFELVESERDLLVKFMEKFDNLDPDIVVGHDLLNFDYETLVMRMNKVKGGVWSKLGRFKRTDLPSTKRAFKYMFSGRVLCDIRTSAMELIRSRSYDLTELVSQVLKKPRIEFNHEFIVNSFKSSDKLRKLIEATWEDNDNIFSILVELNIIPLALKITNITGNILSRTLAAGRSERNEYLLLHAFHEDDFICPEKQMPSWNKKSAFNKISNADEQVEFAPNRKKAAYSGGLVLEPKAGYYDSCVLLMDFNSLYPSIIQEYNICFSTVKVPDIPVESPNAEVIAELPDDSVGTGILPSQLKNLVERRRMVKRSMADPKSSPEAKLMLDIEQKALKLTANSMYGCLGFEQSRFYAKHLASLVTFKGREILLNTKAMVEKLGYEVIYGDTDSLMIDTKVTDYDEVLQKGSIIKGEINRTFKLLEIDIDGVYRPLLLLKKKNYAGSTIKKNENGEIVATTEIKGLDTVRRDRAIIAKEVGEKVLEMILSGEKEIDQTVEDIHNYLKSIGNSIRANELPLEKFCISKQLGRDPEEYRDTKGIGHVNIALRFNKDPKNGRKKKAGDTIEYVVCVDGTGESANQRGYLIEELKSQPEKLKLDSDYYLCQQIHPVMTRICDKLPVTNAYVLAEMLGIEKCSLLHIKRDDTDISRRDQLISKGESRFNSCKPLEIECPNCHLSNEIKSRLIQNKESKMLELSMSSCPHCKVRYALKQKHIIWQIISLIKRLTVKLYNSRFRCENADCDYQTRNVFCYLTTSDQTSFKAQPICDLCDSPMLAEMDDRKLDMQLSYMKYLFDATREEHRFGKDVAEAREDELEMYSVCHEEINHALRSSFINNIDTHSLFSMICSGRENS